MDGGGELYRKLLPERFAPCPFTPWNARPVRIEKIAEGDFREVFE